MQKKGTCYLHFQKKRFFLGKKSQKTTKLHTLQGLSFFGEAKSGPYRAISKWRMVHFDCVLQQKEQ